MANSERYMAISGSERTPLPGAEEVGPADPNEEIKVTVLVRRRPDSALASLVDEIAVKAPAERRYLTREELASQHGADPADLTKVAEWANRRGLRVLETSPLNRTVVLSGRVEDLSSAFQVNLARYRHETGTYRGRTGPVHVPADLADIVEGVIGLDDRPQARPRVVVSDPAKVLAPAAATSLTPVRVAQLYQFPSGSTGQGECIGIIELGGGFKTSDLQTFFNNLSIQEPTVVAVSVDSATNSPSTPPAGADFEVGLDIEVAGAVAPGARIAVYFAPNSDQGFLDAITTAVHDTTNNPGVISISWGSPESGWTNQSMDAMEQAFQDAAALGVSVFCASGDNGSSDGQTDGLAHVDFPASAPHASGCGGTHLEAAGATITSEVVWSGSGGGVSDHFGLPSWQIGVGVPTSVNPNHRVGRGVPDVSGDADPSTGYEIVVGGSTVVVGGTSAVSPLWSGLLALFNQAVGQHLGFLNPQIYRPPESATFRDIASGNNGGYAAAAGWDACTGLGTPVGTPLLQALASPGFLLQTGTPITEADAAANFAFGVGDFNKDGIADVYCLKRTNTGTGKLEVHILNGADNYQSFNKDGIADVYCLKRTNTGTGKLEVHILNGADNYQSFLLQTGTPIAEADAAANFAFGVGDFNKDGIADVYCLKRTNTGTGKLEVHIVSKAP